MSEWHLVALRLNPSPVSIPLILAQGFPRSIHSRLERLGLPHDSLWPENRIRFFFWKIEDCIIPVFEMQEDDVFQHSAMIGRKSRYICVAESGIDWIVFLAWVRRIGIEKIKSRHCKQHISFFKFRKDRGSQCWSSPVELVQTSIIFKGAF